MPAFRALLQVYFDTNLSLQNIPIVLLLMYMRPEDQFYAVAATTGYVLSTFIGKKRNKKT